VAVIERRRPDAGDAVGNRDARQVGAAFKRPNPDAGDAVRNRDVGQAGALIKRQRPDASNAVGNRDVCQAGAVIERRRPDAGDAIGNRDAGQAGATGERRRPYAGNRITINCTGNGQCCRRPGVSRDGDCVVVYGVFKENCRVGSGNCIHTIATELYNLTGGGSPAYYGREA